MDIRDIKESAPELKGDMIIFFEIWKKQVELLEHYKRIEKLPDYPIPLYTRAAQNMIKDFIGRVDEELAEAFEAFENGEHELGCEELADALHFLLEIYIYTYNSMEEAVAGAEEIDLCTVQDKAVCPRDFSEAYFWNVTYHLNLARNFLRNKDWKQTQVLPKLAEFKKELDNTMYALNWLFASKGLFPHDIWEYYWKKNKVNQFRIKSKY